MAINKLTQQQEDLEWLAGWLGWTDLRWIKAYELVGIHPNELSLMAIHRLKTNVPRYDESIDLMVGLVGALSHDEKLRWCGVVIKIIEPIYDYQIAVVSPDVMLRAFRLTMENTND